LFFPFGDTPRTAQYKPAMTRLLIIANVLVFYFSTDAYTLMHGYKPGAPSWIDLFISLFLHGSGWHLLGNMVFLWIFGNNVEHRLGKWPFLLAYLASGAVATLSFGLLAGDSMTPLVGASGAISGILGLYFVMFPRNKIKVLVMLFPLLVTVWHVPARIMIGILLVVDNVLPFVAGSSTGVAYAAHIGGFIAGVVVGWFGERYGWSPRWIWRAFTGKREIIKEVPKTERRDPRSIIIEGEIIDDGDSKKSN
jgi:membrane associated rhomboid family serine protease